MAINIKKYTVSPKASIKQALRNIDRYGIGQVFIVDKSFKLFAIATDGDIRRALLQGAGLNSPITRAANTKPFFVYKNSPPKLVSKLFEDPRIKILPVVGPSKRLMSFIDKYRERIRYPVARPLFEGNELKYVTDALLSGWVSSSGPYISKFEKEFAKFCRVKYAVACSNGTAALHLALLGLGVGPGDEVIVPSLTFIATANAVRYVGAIPVFADVENAYWQIDPAKIDRAITKKTKAIIPVHLYGHPAKMDEILAIAKKNKLFVIEDAAEALGAEVNQKRVGGFGNVGTFSFFGNKIITTGEGGMITTNNLKIAEKIRILRDHGMSKKRRYFHEVLGYNYRLTNIQAALGLAQLERIEDILKRKIKLAAIYGRYLKGIPFIKLPQKASWAKSVYWMYSICLLPGAPISRDRLINDLKKAGVETRPFFMPIHKQPIYSKYASKSLVNTELLSSTGINLPSSIEISEADIKSIVQKLAKLLGSK